MIKRSSAAIAAGLMLIVGMVIGDAVLPNRAGDSVLPQISELIINEGYSITQQQTLTKVAADAMLRAAGDQWGSYQRSLPTTEEVEVSAETVSLTPFKRAVVIKVSHFSVGTAKEIKRILRNLTGSQGVVLDLRNNQGGLLAEAVATSSLFLEDELVTTVTSREADPVTLYADGAGRKDFSVVVLINAGTASSAEVVASALQDHGRAVIVGSRSFGKASVQETFELKDNSKLLLTVGRFIRPSGAEIDGLGISPDVPVAATGDALKMALNVAVGLNAAVRGR
ncbi:MAG: S41 family peptidase [Candidatus Nanopelagicales bacterium]